MTIEKQVKHFRKDLDDGSVIITHVRHDDICRNGHNTFAITTDVYRAKDVNGIPVGLTSCGCQHDLVAEHFPELKSLIKWHLCSTDGPMHYIANTLYWAKQGNYDYARSSAIWPEVSDSKLNVLNGPLHRLNDRIQALEQRLRDRLPQLQFEFRQAVESLGMTF